MKIVIAESMNAIGVSKLQSLGTVELLPDLWRNKNDLIQRVADADALIVRNQTKVDEAVFRAGKQLKVVGRLGVGLDNIDLAAAKKLHVKIISAKNANAVSVAEYVMAVILTSARQLEKANHDVKKGHWNRTLFTGTEIYGKTLGLIGVGAIGHRLAKRARAFGMEVIGYDPYLSAQDFPFIETGIAKVALDEVLKSGDFISIHTPLTKETRSLIGRRELRLMKKGAVLINTSRGGIVDEESLKPFIGSDHLAGAFLDVLKEEPLTKESGLLKNDKITITPHIAGLTKESQERIADIVSEEVINVLSGKTSLNLVPL